MPRPWQGIVGRGMSAQEFDAYVAALPLRNWMPDFCVVHNTGIPLFSQWHRVPGPARMRALESYYRDDQKWSAGPHLFVADDLIWAFTPLYTPGVHAPSWNSVAWGVECVGDFNTEEVPDALLANVVAALATLHRKASIDPSTLRFHREDPLTTHKVCPGSNLSKPDLIEAVQGAMGLVLTPSTPSLSFPVLRLGARGPDVARLQQLLGMVDVGAGAGIFGPKTQAAVIAFQKSHGLVADGIVGGSTWRSLA